MIALPPDLCADSGQQFVPVDRLQQVIVGAKLEALGDAAEIAFVRDQKDRRLTRPFMAAKLRAETKSVLEAGSG